MRILMALAVLFLFGSSTLHAQGRISIEPYAGVQLTDDDWQGTSLSTIEDPLPEADRSFESDITAVLGVRAGFPLRGPWSAEFTYGWTSFDVRTHVTFEPGPMMLPDVELPLGDYALHFLELGVRWELSTRGRVRPFLTLAPGLTFARFRAQLLSLEAESGWLSDPALALGGGVVWELREGVGIRFDARDHVRFCSDACFPEATLHEIELSAGVALDL